MNHSMKQGLVFVAAGLFLAGCATVSPPIPVVPATTKAVIPQPQGGTWWKDRHESFNQLAAKGGFDVMFVGDSITHGWESRGAAVWQKEMAPLKAVNFGISSACTEHVLWRFEHGNLDGALNPKVLVLMLGTNNSGIRKDKPEEIAAGIGAVLRKFHARFPKARILLLAIFPRGADATDSLRLNNEAANKLLAKYDGFWNVKYLDINRKFLADDGTLSRTIMPDLLHPNDKGYQIWADAIVPEIKAALEK